MSDLVIRIIGCIPGSIALGFGIGMGIMCDRPKWLKLLVSIVITLVIFLYVLIGSFWV